MREPEPTTNRPQLLVVVVRDRRQGNWTDLLPGEAAVVESHESRGGGARGQTPRPAKHGLDGEVRVEAAGPDGGLQGTDMDVEFFGQLVEWQLLVLSLVIGDRVAGTLQHCDGDDAAPALPWAEGLEGNRQERGERALSRPIARRSSRSSFIAAHTMPFLAVVVKRPPASMTGGRHRFRAWRTCDRMLNGANWAKN